jgi:hypothetical protein
LAKIGMSEKSISIESYGKSFLVLLLPISFLIIFFVSTWRVWLVLAVLLTGVNLWQRYQWQQWCLKVNPVFHEIIQANQGKITPMDLAIKGNFPGNTAKRYLETKVDEFGATLLIPEQGDKVYYFLTSSILGNILDSSEPLQELAAQVIVNPAPELLAAPPPKFLESEPETVTDESLPEKNYEEVHIPLEQQLLFGSLIQSELAKRLNVYSSTVYKRRSEADFSEWTRSRDPDGIAWTYSPETREFFPMEEVDSSKS